MGNPLLFLPHCWLGSSNDFQFSTLMSFHYEHRRQLSPCPFQLPVATMMGTNQDDAKAENRNTILDEVSSPDTSSSSNNVGSVAAKGTIMTFLLRLVSFGCTQWTIRYIDPEILGQVNIQLELLLTTVLFISREGFRLSLTKNIDDKNVTDTTKTTTTTKEKKDASTNTTIISNKNWNVAWLTIPVTTFVSGCALCWHVWLVSSSSLSQRQQQDATGGDNNGSSHDYFYAGIIYCLASWIEGCAEPAVLYSLRRMEITTRVSAEGIATIVKTIATVVLLQPTTATLAASILRLLMYSTSVTATSILSYPATILSIAQLLYALTYATYLYRKVPISTLIELSRRSVLPTSPSTSSSILSILLTNLHWPTCTLTFVFTLQGFFKHMLTEADRIVLSTISDNYDQGVYAMGSAYGGMAARILLQPLEENARLLWSRLASTKLSSLPLVPPPATKQPLENIHDPLEQSYTVLVKLVVFVGLIFSCVAVNYTHLLLSILAGRKWAKNAQASTVLSAFCVYTAFLAWNGMTEAFVYGVTTSQRDVGRLGMAHTITGVIFAIAAPFFVSIYGTVGLVTANCIAMSIRSVYSVYFATCYFNEREQSKHQASLRQTLRRLLRTMLPHPVVLTTFVVSWVLTRWSWMRVQQVHRSGFDESSDNLYDIALFYEEYDIRNKKWLLLSLQHVLVGVSCAVGIALISFIMEVDFRRSLVSLFRDRKMQDSKQEPATNSVRPKLD